MVGSDGLEGHCFEAWVKGLGFQVPGTTWLQPKEGVRGYGRNPNSVPRACIAAQRALVTLTSDQRTLALKPGSQ